MANFDQKLTASATEMFNDILAEMENRKFKSVNFPLLLWGVVNSTEENSVYSALENYLFGLEDPPLTSDIEESLSELIMEIEPPHAGKDNGKTITGDAAEKANSEDGSETAPTETSVEPSTEEPPVAPTQDTVTEIPDTNDDEKPEIVTVFTFTDNTGKELVIPADPDVEKVFEELIKILQKFNIQNIEPLHITSAMFMTDHEAFSQFFRDLNCNYDVAKKHFHPDRILVFGVIPFPLAGFLSTLNEKIDGKAPCEILCRDKEVDILWNIMLKKNKRNAVIVGEPGVGKSALIEKLAHDINSGKCPEEFKKFKIVVLDVNALIAGTSYRGDAEERIMELINFLMDNDDIILFIDEVHTILGAGSCFEGEMDLANALKPILARGDTIVLGATTEEEYEKYFKKDGALSRRFEKVVVKEPMANKVYPMIKNKLIGLSEFHKVTISKDMVNYAIMIASCFAFEKKNPDKTLDLIDRAMVYAKRHGKKKVDKTCVLRTFDIFFEMWDKMSIETRKEIAYHEAGHYIVGKASGRLTRYTWQAVSIMPAENYLGVTVAEEDDTVVPFANTDYYIDDVAFNLGGRVAESMFHHDYTSGASADLENATMLAHYIITKLGMGNDSIKNRTYLNSCNYPMYSEKATDIINDEIDKLIKKAEDRANSILTTNRDVLEAIVEALLKQKIMSEHDLDKVWKSTVAKRSQP